jgi:3-hydroxyacyl-CoA dehydrogenase/3a,7a,12a-trihydroxy-5b-cholest-24-enoyl-CoA hydratase
MNSLKIEGKKYNIHVNTISPGAASRLTQDLLPADMAEKMDPRHVTPLAVYLCSDRCTATGNIYNAMMGFFGRVAICTGPGAAVRRGDKPAAVEDIISNLDKISTLEGAIESEDANAQMGSFLEHM